MWSLGRFTELPIYFSAGTIFPLTVYSTIPSSTATDMLEIETSIDPFAVTNNSLYLKLLEWKEAARPLASTMTELWLPALKSKFFDPSETWNVLLDIDPWWKEMFGI